MCTAANDPEKWFYQLFFHFCMILSVFFIYLLPYKWFCQWKCGHNVVYLKNLPCFFELKFWAEPGQAVTPQHGDTRQGHTPAATINGDYVMLQNNHQFSAQSMLRFPKTDSKQCKHKRRWPSPTRFLKCYCQAAHHWAPSLSLILTDSC